jgi:hypothetical protein
MAEFFYPAVSRMDGPFLIDRAQLEALDKILNSEWARFEAEHEEALAEAIERKLEEKHMVWQLSGASEEDLRGIHTPENELRKQMRAEIENSYGHRKERICSITFANEAYAKVSDFASAIHEPDLQDTLPTGFTIYLCGRDRKCQLALWTPSVTGRMEITVEPKGDKFVEQTLAVLKDWQKSVRPVWWHKLWSEIGFAIWGIWIIAVVMSGLFLSQSQDAAVISDYRNQAWGIVTNGVTATNQGKAMELMLMKTFSVYPKVSKTAYPHWFWMLIFGGAAYCIAISLRPQVALSIGRGEKRVKFWRCYSRVVGPTIPLFIFSTIYLPRIEAFLKTLFP